MIHRVSSLSVAFTAVLFATATLPAAPAAAELAPGAKPAASAAHAVPLTRDAFVAGLKQELGTHFNLEGDLDLDLLRSWTPPAQVASSWSITIVEFPAVASSAMMIRCRITADGQVVAEPSLVVRASLWRDAWATRAPLTINSTFDPSLLEARRVDLFRERDALPAAVGDRSYIFARGVTAGHLLTWHDIARRPLVKRGEMVDVSAIDGSLVVTMKAMAMENGAQGDTVTVRNPESRKDFAAMVIDENHVQVRF